MIDNYIFCYEAVRIFIFRSSIHIDYRLYKKNYVLDDKTGKIPHCVIIGA